MLDAQAKKESSGDKPSKKEMPMSHPIPGYLVTLQEVDAFLGGTMITDHHGIPIDFKYTDPIVPTKVQRIIYGSVLETYIRNHVLVTALAKEIGVPPSFFMVLPDQLAAIQGAQDLLVVAVQRTQFASLGEPGAVTKSKEGECLVQGNMSPHPLKVVFGETGSTRQKTILDDIVRLSKYMDVVEPLERLQTALKSLYQELKQHGNTSRPTVR